MISREPIYAALFARLQACYPWVTSSRILKHWADVPAQLQPAMFMTQVGENAETISRQRPKWRLHVKAYVYMHAATQSGVIASQLLNPVLDAVSQALQPDYPTQESQTLGGLVSYARIEGNLETDEGFLGDQAVAIIPITLLTAV